MAKRIVTEAWLFRGRRARKRNARRYSQMHEHLETLLKKHVAGKSFADIGGMWGIHGGHAFLAEDLGATAVTEFDGMAPTDEFVAEHERRRSRVRFVQGDFHDPVSVEEVGRHDVVLCSGVIYHSANPYLLIDHLHRITGELLLLGSHTIPEAPGMEGVCVFYPALSDASRAAYARVHRGHYMPAITEPVDRTRHNGYANMVWGITPSAMRGMLDIAGFDLEETLETAAQPFFTYVVARPRQQEPVFPPVHLNRVDAEQARAEGRIPVVSPDS